MKKYYWSGLLAVVTFCFMTFNPVLAAAYKYSVSGLGPPPGNIKCPNGSPIVWEDYDYSSIAMSINDNGAVTGELRDICVLWTAFLWTSEQGMSIVSSSPDTFDVCGAAILNNNGVVALECYLPNSNGSVYTWNADNGLVPLGMSVDLYGYITPEGISDTGRIALWSSSGMPVVWDSDGTVMQLGVLPGHHAAEAYDMNNKGQVVGGSYNYVTYESEAFLWSAESGMVGLGAYLPSVYMYSYAKAINNNGDIVISAWTGETGYKEMLWSESRGLVSIGFFDYSSHISAINDNRMIVGGGDSAFIWTEETGRLSLNDLIDPASGWYLEDAFDINNVGQIVGVGTDPAGHTRAFLLTPVVTDTDNDGVATESDNCPDIYNPDQLDFDLDARGDACDDDDDNDGIVDAADVCPLENSGGQDANLDGCLDQIDDLPALIGSLELPPGLEQSLGQKIEGIMESIAAGAEVSQDILNRLSAFINEIEAQSGKKISEEDAAMLIEYANNLLASL